nr:unnamed protein product [Digitaria exilis]CAB3487508.1 unnamed protein product [Digitaria exilis]
MDYSPSKESPPTGAWWSRETVAVVTGANRGIGHALAARLAEHGLTVVLTARDGERGETAAAPLRARGLAVVFRRLDVSDPASVAEFAAWLRDALGGLDVLDAPNPSVPHDHSIIAGPRAPPAAVTTYYDAHARPAPARVRQRPHESNRHVAFASGSDPRPKGRGRACGVVASEATAAGQVVQARRRRSTTFPRPLVASRRWTVTLQWLNFRVALKSGFIFCSARCCVQVNNAAVSFNEIDTNSVEHAETVLRTNFYGAKMLTEALLPLFRQSPATSRILNISSQLGLLNKVRDPSLKAMLQDEDTLTEAAIEAMASRFLAQVKDGTWGEQGWPKVWTDYSVSKLALNAYSRLLARRLQARGARVSVNCFCPGFTRTDMTKGWGKRTAEEVADVGARLALLPPAELPTGTFFKWCTPQLYSKL